VSKATQAKNNYTVNAKLLGDLMKVNHSLKQILLLTSAPSVFTEKHQRP
jgi:hypothetical protein